MGLIYGKVVFDCPACNGQVVIKRRHFLEWKCIKCHRMWGIETKKPVFELRGD